MSEKEKATARLNMLVNQLKQVPKLVETEETPEEMFRREARILRRPLRARFSTALG